MLDLARREIQVYLQYGIHPLVENYFGSEDDCEEILNWLHKEHPDAIYGVNILGDHPYSFELANKYGAKFIQIDSVCGHEEPKEDEILANELCEYRRKSNAVVLGGVRFKYYPVNSGRPLAEDLRLGMQRCDAIVCTGSATGKETPLDKVHDFRNKIGEFPIIVGAGVTLNNAQKMMNVADGAIIGSWFKYGHNTCNMVNVECVKEFMNQIHVQI